MAELNLFEKDYVNYKRSRFMSDMKEKYKLENELAKYNSSEDKNNMDPKLFYLCSVYNVLDSKLSDIPNVFKKNENSNLFEKIFNYKEKSLQEIIQDFEKKKKEFVELYDAGLAFPSWPLLGPNVGEGATLGFLPKGVCAGFADAGPEYMINMDSENKLIIMQGKKQAHSLKFFEEDGIAPNTSVIFKGGCYLCRFGLVDYIGPENKIFKSQREDSVN